MHPEVKKYIETRRKLLVLEYAELCGNVLKACREFEVARASFYRWKRAYDKGGRAALVRKQPIARSHPRQIPPDYVEKILHLRMKYHLGPQRIAWYLERYHDFKTSCSSVYRTLKRNGIGPLPLLVYR